MHPARLALRRLFRIEKVIPGPHGVKAGDKVKP